MINNVFRKSLVIGIIVLFIGASVTPSISGGIRESSTITDIEVIETKGDQRALTDIPPPEKWDKTFREESADYSDSEQQIIDAGYIMGDWLEQAKLTASDGATNDMFGDSVSMDGDYAIIGAFNGYYPQENSGLAYIFKRTGTKWSQEAKLTASDGTEDDGFGWSVSIDGEYVIIGAPADDQNGYPYHSGSAYIFKRTGTTWSQEAKLIASDCEMDDLFGWSVSISGDYALIGALGDDDNGEVAGSAYIFKRTGTIWSQEAKLLASDGDGFDLFGCSVSLDEDYALIGARQDRDNGPYSGSAYVFKRDGTSWTQQAKLLASDGYVSDHFGWSVSIDGEYAIIGAEGDDDNGSHSGSAYVFKRDGTSWTQQAKLLASDGDYMDFFGRSVSISGDYVLVGAESDDNDNGEESGSAYVFKQTGPGSWIEEKKLVASDGAEYDSFGVSVYLDGDYAIIGAPRDDDNGGDSGSAYVFEKSDGNQPPNKPSKPSGPLNLDVDQIGEYSTSAIDPDEDKVQYRFDWGDGKRSTWTSLVDSGQSAYKSHSWGNDGTYTVKAQARDEHRAKSVWSDPLFVVVGSGNRPPYEPKYPIPSNGAIQIFCDTVLQWVSGDPDNGDTVTYDIYFGTSSSPPKIASITEPAAKSVLYWDPPGYLEYDTKYYWKIKATDYYGESTTSSLWWFTTETKDWRLWRSYVTANKGDDGCKVEGGLSPYGTYAKHSHSKSAKSAYTYAKGAGSRYPWDPYINEAWAWVGHTFTVPYDNGDWREVKISIHIEYDGWLESFLWGTAKEAIYFGVKDIQGKTLFFELIEVFEYSALRGKVHKVGYFDVDYIISLQEKGEYIAFVYSLSQTSCVGIDSFLFATGNGATSDFYKLDHYVKYEYINIYLK